MSERCGTCDRLGCLHAQLEQKRHFALTRASVSVDEFLVIDRQYAEARDACRPPDWRARVLAARALLYKYGDSERRRELLRVLGVDDDPPSGA